MRLHCPVCDRPIEQAAPLCDCGYRIQSRDASLVRDLLRHELDGARRQLLESVIAFYTLPITFLLALATTSVLFLLVFLQFAFALGVGIFGEVRTLRARKRLKRIDALTALPAARVLGVLNP